MTPESKVRAPVIQWARKNNIQVCKFDECYNPGMPDRLFLLPRGSAVFIEFKAKGKRPRAHQNVKLRTLTNRGYRAVWFDESDRAIEYLESLLRGDIK